MYAIVNNEGMTVSSGYTSRQEAKAQRRDDQFVIRSARHPLGRSKTGALSARKDKEGNRLS
jgi:hypothetical protein